MKDKRGSSSGAPGRKLFRQSTLPSIGADWNGADAEVLKQFTLALIGVAGAVRYGYTRDGANYSVGVYGDGDPYTLYCAGSYDITVWLRERILELGAEEKAGVNPKPKAQK